MIFRTFHARTLLATGLLASGLPGVGVHAATSDTGWAACTQADANARLACFDAWAQQQAQAPVVQPAAQALAGAPAPKTTEPAAETETTLSDGCRDRQYSALSRYWELEKGSNCNTFGIRGYRPVSLSFIGADSVNDAPNSPSAGHQADPLSYQRVETRIQLSVRTKIAEGLFTTPNSDRHDSLWFGYTQQSYWQLFNGAISRPFRNTDHEPEVIYVYPSTADLPGGWRLRYSGLGVVHQSNGQSLPLSRSWNRMYLMGGIEHGNSYRLMGRVWQRLPEKYNDDNPDIVAKVGRAEIQGTWDVNQHNTLSTTVRNTFATRANGSVRLEWLRTLGDPATSGLRLHTQLFSGYGDSLVDYNRRRVVFSLGLSLVDF